ncbi:MAG: sigma-70 family RNA polymerase sigma factor [Planctomycetes bacterium]|nr:sigma-70 family RNA polymerase sigma factor [Planctomycetota bacterium]
MNDSSPATLSADLQAASEEDLAGRVQGGCAESFAELVARLQPRLMFVLRRRLRNEADVEDVAQKTLFRAYEKIHLYDPTRKFSPWLFTIAIRLAADHYRQKKIATEPTGETASTIADPQPSPAQQAISREQSDDLWAVARRLLKPDQWTALWLLYGEGQTVREIASTLDRTSVSIRVLLYRARKKLTPHLAKYSETVDKTIVDAEPTGFNTSIAPQVVRAEL